MTTNYKLRIAAAVSMLLTILCNFAQGKHAVPLLLVGQVLFGLTTLVLLGLVLFSTARQSSGAAD